MWIARANATTSGGDGARCGFLSAVGEQPLLRVAATNNWSEVHKIHERARDARLVQAISLCPRYLDLLYSSDVTIHYSAFLIKEDFCWVQTAVVHGCRASVLLGPHAVARGVHWAVHRVPVAARGPELVERRARRDPHSARAHWVPAQAATSLARYGLHWRRYRRVVLYNDFTLRVIRIYYTLLSLKSVSLLYFKTSYYRWEESIMIK